VLVLHLESHDARASQRRTFFLGLICLAKPRLRREPSCAAMKYMLLMNVPAGPYRISSWPPEDMQAHIGYMMRLNSDLKAKGELVAAEALSAPDQARLVRAGDFPVTDGIFAESKEFLAGYWLVDVANAERANEIALAASAAPGPRGVPLNLAIEVREVLPPLPSKPSE
jgi:hypothetical protein